MNTFYKVLEVGKPSAWRDGSLEGRVVIIRELSPSIYEYKNKKDWFSGHFTFTDKHRDEFCCCFRVKKLPYRKAILYSL